MKVRHESRICGIVSCLLCLSKHVLIPVATLCAQLPGKPAGIERDGSADALGAHPALQFAAEPAGVSGRLAPTRSCNVGVAAAHGLLAGTQLSLSAELAASAARNGVRLPHSILACLRQFTGACALMRRGRRCAHRCKRCHA